MVHFILGSILYHCQHRSCFFHYNAIKAFHSGALCTGKHWDPKFRKLRAKKVIKITLPDYDEQRRDEKMTADEIRAKMKEKGIAPPRRWDEKPIFISSTAAILDPYLPPEGDGKISLISKLGMKQKFNTFEKKGKSYMSIRKIRNFEENFDVPSLAEKAQNIYIEAHNALCSKDEDKLHDLVTEKCYPEMMDNAMNKTLRWKFIQSLELPCVVHVRCDEMLSKDNVFAQATIRFHTQQTLAVYDRFGRLMHGSEDKVKDVLEYVVFEKHLSNIYGMWRIHGKIIPDWMPQRDSIIKTFYKPKLDHIDVEESEVEKSKSPEDKDKQVTESPLPAVA